MTFSSLFSLCFVVFTAATMSRGVDSKKVLFILTNVDKIPNTDIKTGWFLGEFAHPYTVLTANGIEVDALSPNGGFTPADPLSVQLSENDTVSMEFLNNPDAKALFENTKAPADINPADYDAVLYPGGHGPIFDLAIDKNVAAITQQVYENCGIVSAICHGSVGLVPVKLSNGEPLVKGREVTGFTNGEEAAAGVPNLPILLETELGKLGATFTQGGLFQSHTVLDGRLLTGQNPLSTGAFIQQLMGLLAADRKC